MKELKRENAIIESTMLGTEDHGIQTAFVFVSGDAWGCGFGGFALDGPYDNDKKKRLPATTCGWFIARVLETVGVDKWEALKGKHVRVETEGLGGGIIAIGNIIKDEWFRPNDELAALLKQESR